MIGSGCLLPASDGRHRDALLLQNPQRAWMSPPPYQDTIVASREQAITWCVARLRVVLF